MRNQVVKTVRHGARRSVGAATAVALTLVVAAVGVLPATPAGAETAGGKSWKAGDCFSRAAMSDDYIDLSSKVPCSKAHALQVLHGASLVSVDPSLDGVSRKAIEQKAQPEYAAVEKAAAAVCNRTTELQGARPRSATALQGVLQGLRTSPPTPGGLGWVVPDAKSFAAGNRDVLCVFEPTKAEVSTKGDLRQLETRAVLPGQRICNSWDEEAAVPCTKVHDIEVLLFFETPLAGRPTDPLKWDDTTATEAERQACAGIGRVVMGTSRADLTLAVYPNAAGNSPGNPVMLLACAVYTTDEKVRLPGGTLTGVGDAPIAFVPA